MKKIVVLLHKQQNYECMQITYNIVTKDTSISLYYKNKEKTKRYKQSKKGREIDRKYSRTVYSQHKKILDKIKNECVICGQNTHLDFHHINPEDKLFNITTAKHKCNAELINEINKCIIICRSCHLNLHQQKL